ncbi:hypothetical protein FACS189490_12390 [Clostridia bacterium]|nr:hypothetical protein FACS189490_12390 [Clostridia bacterium]
MIGTKIREIREAKGISQYAVARILKISPATMSRIENNFKIPDADLLKRIRSVLGVSLLPLTDEEIADFPNEVLKLNSFVKTNSINEADAKCLEIGNALEFFDDNESAVFYEIFKARLFRQKGDFKEAKRILDSLSEQEYSFTSKQRYHYYCTYGAYHMGLAQYISALKCFIKVENADEALNTSDESTYYNMAVCFNAIDFVGKASVYFALAERKSNAQRSLEFDFNFNLSLALLYNKVGEFVRAKDLFFVCLDFVKRNADIVKTGIVFHNLACVYSNLNDYKNTIEYFTKAEQCFKPDSGYFLVNLLYKSYFLLSLGRKHEVTELVNTGMKVAGDDSDIFVLFKSVKCSLNLKDFESIDYIENTTIPHLLEHGSFLKAIEYCDLLGSYYQKKKNLVMAVKFKDLSIRYNEKIMRGDLE